MKRATISPAKLSALLLLGCSAAAYARPDVESLAGAGDGPNLSAAVSNFIEQGFSRKGSSASATDTALSYGIETPDGQLHVIVMDPISGDVSASH